MPLNRREAAPEITKGAYFERLLAQQVKELAEVVWVGEDAVGIPHVRFNVSYVRSQGLEAQGSRMLAVASFAQRYRRVRFG